MQLTAPVVDSIDKRALDVARSLCAIYPAIEDYAVIGYCRTIALIACSGANEWLCLPHFASASLFAALLDRRLGGACTLCPQLEHTAALRYIPDTAIPETLFTPATGRVRVLDFLSIDDGDRRWQVDLQPQDVAIPMGMRSCSKAISSLLRSNSVTFAGSDGQTRLPVRVSY